MKKEDFYLLSWMIVSISQIAIRFNKSCHALIHESCITQAESRMRGCFKCTAFPHFLKVLEMLSISRLSFKKNIKYQINRAVRCTCSARSSIAS